MSVLRAGPTGSSCSLLGSSWREGDRGGGREAKGWAGGRADREGTNREGAERETREGAGGAEMERRREEGQLGGRGQASRAPWQLQRKQFSCRRLGCVAPLPPCPPPWPLPQAHFESRHTHLLRDRPLVSLGRQPHRVKLSTAQMGTLRCLLACCQVEEREMRGGSLMTRIVSGPEILS